MNKRAKYFILFLVVVGVVGAAVGYFMWNKPHRDVENEKGIEVTAAQLVKDYQLNEAQANSKYLDKAIQVTGTVTEVKATQDGNATVMLASEDAFTGVFCTLKEKSENVAIGTTVTIKGICSGMLTDVRLREAVVVK
jgi:hypothetical protein